MSSQETHLAKKTLGVKHKIDVTDQGKIKKTKFVLDEAEEKNNQSPDECSQENDDIEELIENPDDQKNEKKSQVVSKSSTDNITWDKKDQDGKKTGSSTGNPPLKTSTTLYNQEEITKYAKEELPANMETSLPLAQDIKTIKNSLVQMTLLKYRSALAALIKRDELVSQMRVRILDLKDQVDRLNGMTGFCYWACKTLQEKEIIPRKGQTRETYYCSLITNKDIEQTLHIQEKMIGTTIGYQCNYNSPPPTPLTYEDLV